jgi:hypothetical protein
MAVIQGGQVIGPLAGANRQRDRASKQLVQSRLAAAGR